MEFHLNYFLVSLEAAIRYAPVTIKITLVTFVTSIILGLIIGAIRYYKVPVLSQFFSVFVTVYLGLPLMVALVLYNIIFMTTYADVAAFFHIKKSISEIDPIYVAYFAMILSYSCHISENVRGAFRGIDKVQFEAGYSIGLTQLQTFFRIILAQMIPIMIPGLINFLIGALKASNLVSAIGIVEVMMASLEPCQKTYSYLEGYLAAALVYWIIDIVIEILSGIVEKKSARFRKQLA